MDKEKLINLLDDCHVSYMEHGNHHCRQGWIQVCCPFCIDGDDGYHLGINIESGYGNCYRCGFHHINAILARLVGVRWAEVKPIVNRLQNGCKVRFQPLTDAILPFILPGETIEKGCPAYEYLAERFPGCDTDAFISQYDLRHTPWFYTFETLDKDGNKYPSNKYALKIVIPNYLNHQAVSFQCRSFWGGEKYYITAKTCEEIIHNKDFLWGIDNVPGNSVLVCEAAFDAMSVGNGAVHTHGCSFTKNQVDDLATFDTVYIAYDMDKPGRDGARKMASYLSHKTNVKIVSFGESVKAKDLNDLLKTEDGKKELNEMRALLTN